MSSFSISLRIYAYIRKNGICTRIRWIDFINGTYSTGSQGSHDAIKTFGIGDELIIVDKEIKDGKL